MTEEMYRAAILRAARISKLLNLKLDEEGLDLFEEYGNIYESIVKYELLHK